MSETSTQAAIPPGNPRILIVGNAGQLGRELERIFAGIGPIVAVDRESVDLADADQTRALVRRAAPDRHSQRCRLHCRRSRRVGAAISPHAVNAQAPRIMAEEALERNALLVHYSTDYVFDGTKPDHGLRPTRPTRSACTALQSSPANRQLNRSAANTLIFRTSWVYGSHGKNFLLTMLRLGRSATSSPSSTTRSARPPLRVN